MLYLTIIGAAFVTWLILVTLFTPAIPYHAEAPIDADSDHFIHVLESTCHTTLEQGNRVDVFTNGTAFYPAMLDAIARARETINLETYIFKKGEIGDRVIAALAARARAGVRVTILMDAIGSFGAFHRSARPLREAGCRVDAYGRMRWYGLARLNNRTHRELLVVDGEIAFVGGAGFADWWWRPQKNKPAWRDMMLRVEGPLVSDVAGVVAENWLECRGEILTGPETFKPHVHRGPSPAFVIKSSPSDRATASRVLFQLLIEGARRRVVIATPYFLPDRPFREAFRRAAARGVEIVVLVPGPQTDQRWVRLASRRLYGGLVRAGIRIYEYGGGMTHVKALLVDDL
ncbi:MAG TPA: phospholipase D-like domain-containing protein, partial [Vicinamibacterales bacterium]